MKRLILAASLVSLTLLCGCKDPYGASAKAAADIGEGIATGLSDIASLQNQGTITKAEANQYADILEFILKGDEAFTSCIDTAHTAGSKVGTFTACAQTFNTYLNNPSSLALVKVTNTQISTTINTAITGVASLLAGLGGQ